MNDDGVYYKIYLSPHTEKLTIVCMQWFDESDYRKKRFYSENGEIPQWDDEDKARKFLNDTFKSDKIDPEYSDGSDRYWHEFKK